MALKIGKEKLSGILIAAGVVGGGMIILMLIADIIVMPIYTRQGSETEVPNVIDLSLQAAQAELHEAGLDAVQGGEEFDSKRPRGMVINQVPEGGAMVKTGRSVTLTLSKGSASARVPSLEGFTLREARNLLEKEGLQPGGIIWFTDETRPDGVIIGSVPPVGTVMRLNADVQLVVNRIESNMTISVPNFVGLDLDRARGLAEENYLLIGEIGYAKNQSLLPETVLAQSIPAGQPAKKWSVVDLTISSAE